ncbi:MAG: hypothetical protein R6V06_02620 [Kiritimatiellia bacterium]
MSEENKESRLQRGVLVEFDYAVMPGHRIMLDVCKKKFAEHKLEIDGILMARYMFGRSFVAGLSALCRAQDISSFEVSDMAEECNNLFAERVKAELKDVPGGFIDFVKALAEKELKVVLFSRVESEVLQALFPDLTEEQLGVSEDMTSSFCFTSWEGWRRFARKNDLHERLCVSICGSGLSVKGALTAGVSSIVRENDMVAYQDISGCDKKIEEFDPSLIKEVERLLHLG